MPIVYVLVGLVVLLVVGLLAVGRFGGLPEAMPDRAPLNLPAEGALSGEQVDEVRLAVGLRGYRMDEVDQVLDRAAAGLRERDERIDFLAQRLEQAGIDPYRAPVVDQDAQDGVAPVDDQDAHDAAAPPAEPAGAAAEAPAE
ncbi:MAG TPA: DivIVA domain-containing protein [Candidatus Nanopelagicales bacterium]|nr:DivIVA domain-containing protein [Candidatus Nanopelagicales bacterium]